MNQTARHHVRGALITLILASTLGACRRQNAVSPTPEAAPAASVPAPTPRDGANDADAEAARRAAEREREEREREDRDARERKLRILTETIHFEFDRSDLSEAVRMSLDAKAEALRAEPTTHIRIEGHADDRGSDEYNLALGMRRASAARRYLTQRGIDPDRIEVTSMGEERPVCQELTESCWQLNRRAEFMIASP